MSANKYETEVDLGDRNTSHTLAVELVGRDKRVLDVGAATGYVAEALVAQGCSVVGIEIEPGAAERAAEHCERMVVGDVESLDLQEELGEETFDVIVCGDVLEHLREPSRVLASLRGLLAPGGYVVASVPNIAHGSVRLALLQGRFEYRPLGLLDETHLRFFTRESLEQMLAEAGYVIADIERVRVAIRYTEVEFEMDQVPAGLLESLRSAPEAETYQFVFAAYPAENTGLVARLSERLSSLENGRPATRKPAHPPETGEVRESAETVYARSAAHHFARRYAGGKSVACVSGGDVGPAARLLADDARSVVGVSGSSEALQRARESYPAPNVSYEHAYLPGIGLPSENFDLVLLSGALERVERPERLVEEARRVLKDDGVLLVSTPDKQVHSNERNHHDPAHKGELYVPELGEMLGRHFDQVSVYRQGAVAGGVIFAEGGGLEPVAVESGELDPVIPSLDGRPLHTRHVLAVCGPEPAEENLPYLLLDSVRQVFDESEDRLEDIHHLEEEVRQMQRTEVQAFREALDNHKSEVARLKKSLEDTEKLREQQLKEAEKRREQQLKEAEAQRQRQLDASRAEVERLRKRLDEIEGSRTWRALGLYRHARLALDELKRKG